MSTYDIPKSVWEKTRKSLIERLDNWEDQQTWDEFYKTYWRLIYSVGLKSGLRSEEAFDLVQETIFSIAKQSQTKRYDPGQGSFKSWLMQMTRWRIADQFRKRAKDTASVRFKNPEDGEEIDPLDRIADPDAVHEKVWEEEWQKHLAETALLNVKEQVSPRQFQIFDCYVIKGWSVRKVMDQLGVSVAQVYLAKHRISSLLRKEVEGLQVQV